MPIKRKLRLTINILHSPTKKMKHNIWETMFAMSNPWQQNAMLPHLKPLRLIHGMGKVI
jgi:hypothetical protein